MPIPILGQEQRQESEYAANLRGVHKIIGVYSGKGGVGKTTVAVNLAALLAKQGRRAGLLDADIDCPDVGKMLGIRERIELADGKLQPIEKFGVKVVSTAFLQAEEDNPLIVRGPIKHNALLQLVGLADWGELDCLIVDLPPGTSDVPLSLMQLLDLDGIIIVTTAQAAAILDAKKSIKMARQLGKKILGVVENMSGDVFGTGAGEALAREFEIPLLGSIPLGRLMVAASNEGKPIVLHDQGMEKLFSGIALRATL